MLDFLPQYIKNALSHVNLRYIYELRLRVDMPIMISVCGEYCYLGEYGAIKNREKALTCSIQDIADCVYKAGKFSVYAIEEQIKQGFITAESGVRIGLAGEYVFERGQPLTLKNFSSLCIRIPHEIIGCGQSIYEKCMSDRINNLLIMSAPGVGKTTILRDLARIISKKDRKNILICDERGELSLGDVGETCDIIKYADKATAFEVGIRALRPDVIITDELSQKDYNVLERAVSAGIKVLASAHLDDVCYLDEKLRAHFDYFVVLDGDKVGQIKGIYKTTDEELFL